MAPKKVKRIDVDPCWGWVHEISGVDSMSPENVRAAYRLYSAPCEPGSCKKNCRLNPCCINGLGEQKWLKSEPSNDVLSPDDFARRKKGELIGLRNRGATCYVNAFLQMCFHNQEFRSAVYAWRGTSQSEGEKSYSDCDDSFPTTVCGLLQYIFASLEFSEMKFVDPTPLLRKLMLDDLEQQDALEFGKLFVNLLTSLPDGACASSATHYQSLRVRINEMFSGECRYITRCHTCGTESAATSSYTEIDARVEGMRGLTDALADYLKDETMDGENMYYCGVCVSKQPACRRIQLKSVPPVLQFHLLRYVYDRKLGDKKKVRSRFQFPEVLAMGPYLGKDDNEDLYDLVAILLHNGTGAYSGHYVAHIRMNGTTAGTGADEVQCLSSSKQPPFSNSSSWFKFSDDVIEPIANPKTELGKVESEEKDVAKSQKVPSGMLTSANAYMLVYQSRQNTKGNARPTDVGAPENIKNIIVKENNAFLSTIAELEKDSIHKKESESATRDFVKETYRSLSLPRDFLATLTPGTVAAISGQWLSQWLKHPDSTTKINNEQFMCEHGKINVNEVPNIKFVSVEGARKLYQRYGVSHELDLTMTCVECVARVCSRKRMEVQMASDLQAINNGIQPDGRLVQFDGYVVGKGSLRVLKTLMERHLAGAHPHGAPAAKLDSTNSRQSVEPIVTRFNEDILCPHGQLCIDERQRAVAAVAAWQKIKEYFPNALEFSTADSACSECMNAAAASKEAASKSRAIAAELRKVLGDVVVCRRRPQPFIDAEVYIIGRSFVDSLRLYISSKRTDLSVPVMDNSQLMCTHGNLCAEPTDSTLMVPLWPHEWLVLLQYFGKINSPISVLKKQDVIGSTDDKQDYTVLPGICQACCMERRASIESQRFKYESVKLCVTRVNGLDARSSLGGRKQQQYGADVADDEDGSDMDYVNQWNSKDAKKRKVVGDAGDGDATVSVKDSEPAGTRRSRRRVRSRYDKEVTVSSSMTLRELKVLLMTAFAVAPFDQTLMLDGRVLEPDSATLEDLQIDSESVIQLKVDESHLDDEDGGMEAALIRDGLQKEGFKGTGLLN